MKVKDYWRPATAAKHIGAPNMSLRFAMSQGRVKVESTGCGQRLVELQSAKQWWARQKKRGKKKGNKRV